VPAVVMAHGFAAQRASGLAEYAQRFADRGLAVLLFDYRHFGDSDGEPRDLVDHRRQQRDWTAAIEHARSIDGIDADAIGLWGSSYSGEHVVSAAARTSGVKAIVAQAPMLDVLRSTRVGPRYVLRASGHIAADYVAAMLGRPPHYISTVAEPSKFAALNQPGCEAGYRALIPEHSDWQNRCTARSLWTSLFFRPASQAARVRYPAMIVIAEHDQVIRARVIEAAAARIPDATVLRVPVDHFQIYQGEVFEAISHKQADFFVRHLIGSTH
jgi:dienelactone hydrolase